MQGRTDGCRRTKLGSKSYVELVGLTLGLVWFAFVTWTCLFGG